MSQTEISDVAKTLGLAFISKKTFNNNVNRYIAPVLKTTWIKHRKKHIEDIKSSGEKITIMGAGRYDSPGKSAYLMSYVAMCAKSYKVIDFFTLKKGAVPGEMEKHGCDVVLERLSDELGDLFDIFLSDRHRGIAKMFP